MFGTRFINGLTRGETTHRTHSVLVARDTGPHPEAVGEILNSETEAGFKSRGTSLRATAVKRARGCRQCPC